MFKALTEKRIIWDLASDLYNMCCCLFLGLLNDNVS